VTEEQYDVAGRTTFFLFVLAGGVAFGIWARWSGSQTNLARWVRTADGGWGWIGAGALLFLTLALARCAP
jgi:hypothetical protein